MWFRPLPPLTVSTSFAELLLQLYTESFEIMHAFLHDLKMFMWFGYSPQINFCHFFSGFELSNYFG